jgi:hypothetical protein
MEDHLIYLASPYTSKYQDTMLERLSGALEASATLIKFGINNISPVVYGCSMNVILDIGDDFEVWKSFCFSLLIRCNAIVILQLKGWEESTGIKSELSLFKEKIGGYIGYITLEELREMKMKGNFTRFRNRA